MVNLMTQQVVVDFPEHLQWSGQISEMEVVPTVHPHVRCDGCKVQPLIGSRYKCSECSDLDFCENCFKTISTHQHQFYCIATPDSVPILVGVPTGSQMKVFVDWSQCVKKLTVSSRENLAHNLVSGSGCWQSAGDQGAHWIRLEMHAGMVIQKLCMKVDPQDNSYMPSLLVVRLGEDLTSMKDHCTVHVAPTDTQVTCLSNLTQYFRFVEIAIKLCRSSGIDCKVHKLSIICRQMWESAPISTSCSYLASDPEENDETTNALPMESGHVRLGQREIKTHVFVWGLNDKDQLGGPKGSKIKAPVLNETLSSLNCVQFSGGAKTLFCVTADGKLYACGEASNGRLGLSVTEPSVPIPKQITSLSQYVIKKVAVHSGGRHAMALTVDGKVFSWGEGDDGKLGHFSRSHCERPRLIEALRSKRVRDIACGSSHSAAIVSNGDLYTWGLGEYGRLGHGDNVTQLRPKHVKALAGQRVIQVALGSRDAQTLAVTEDGTVYSWGDGDFGKLGRGGSEGCNKPEPISMLKPLEVCQIECGAQFSVILTKAGEVYTWGKGDYYRLGHGTDIHQRKPCLVESLKDKKVVHISVGALHCLAVTDTGQVYAWGDNDHGQQGNNTTNANRKAALVHNLDSYKITKVACGSSHSIAWCTSHTCVATSHEPVLFTNAEDTLGATVIENKIDDTLDVRQKSTMEHPPLSKMIMGMDTIAAKQKALEQILYTLHIYYSREAVINTLNTEGPVVKESENNKPQAPQEVLFADIQGSFHTLAKASPSTSIVAETLFTAEQVTSSDDTASHDDVCIAISADSARVLVDLLKLAVVHRVGEQGKSTLIHVLKALCKRHPQVRELLLELCVTELEDIASARDIVYCTGQPVVQESPHPYLDDSSLTGHVKIPGAEALRVEFDHQCSTERRHDTLTIMDCTGRIITVRSGREWTDWSAEVLVRGEEIKWKFISDGSVNGWGWRMTVHPIQPSVIPLENLSDRRLLCRPSIQLVMSLLESVMVPQQHPILSRLIGALVTAAQISALVSYHRVWALRKLQIVIQQHQLKTLISDLGSTQLNHFIQSLPTVLQRQFEYEEPLVRSGKQLMHTLFFKELLGLGCELDVDGQSVCQKDEHSWQWLRRYCVAARTATAVSQRTPLPPAFCEEVTKKVQEVCSDHIDMLHFDHTVFRQEHDEQLLLWSNRKPEEWVLSWGGNGQIWGWGHNHRGQLGGIAGAKVKLPTSCDALAGLQPAQIVGGDQTVFIVTTDGRVYCTGFGAGWRLGTGSTESTSIPILLDSLRRVFIKKVAVNSGGKHCLALSADGEMYSWGEGEDGKLGHGDRVHVERPQVIETLRGVEVVDIAAGGSHSACIAATGHLYTWGKGRYGRLGHGDSEDQLRPKLVEILQGHIVKDVACGSGDAQTLCLTSDDTVWSWGDGDYGKLGRGGSDGVKVPTPVDALKGLGVCLVACGSQFSVALTKSGAIYTWGKGDYHRLGHGRDEHVRKPKRIQALEGKKIVAIACGSLHCIVCSDTGDVFVWGDNDEGQLGDGSTNAIPSPRQLIALKGKKITKVACGSAHSLAWSTNKPVQAARLPGAIPLEYNHLHQMPVSALRNRLILLHYLSDILCPCIPMLSLETAGHLRGILTSTAKESAFRKIIQNTMVRDKQHGPVIEINRMQVKRSRTKKGLAGPDGCRSVFGQVCSKMSLFDTDCLMLPHRVWKVKFVGESVDDCGGGYSESIAEMCDELQNGSLPLLIQTPNGRDESGSNRDCFLLNPSLSNLQHKDMFYFLGVLFGIAIRTGSPLSLNLAEPVWKQLAGLPLLVRDLTEIDKEYVPGLMCIRDMDEDTLISADMPFSTPSATGNDIVLSTVYNKILPSNRNEYVRLALNYRLHEFDQQEQWVREGMSKVIPVPLLSLFTGSELETMVCGSPDIPLSLLSSVATYKNVEPTAPLIKWFWEVMEELTNQERSLFLRFVWGRTRLPRTIADFRGRDFVIQAMDKYSPPNNYLPESYTCFFLLKLPRYTSKTILEEKLKYAIYFCKSIDTDDYARVALTSEPYDDGVTGLEGNDEYADD